MIVDAIVTLLLALATGVLGLIPSFELPELDGFGTAFGGGVKSMNAYFPVVTLGACLLAILAVKVFVTAFDLLVFLYGLLPFKAT